MRKKDIKGWRDVSLAIARKLDEIDGDLITQDVKVVSALLQLDEDEVWSKPLDEVNLLTSKIKWVYEGIPDGELTEILFNGMRFVPTTSPDKMTFAQYVDLQQCLKDVKKYRGEIIAALFVPENGKYNSGYDMEALIRHIYDTVDMTQFKGFFLSSLKILRTSMKHSMERLRKVNRTIWEKMETLLAGLGL